MVNNVGAVNQTTMRCMESAKTLMFFVIFCFSSLFFPKILLLRSFCRRQMCLSMETAFRNGPTCENRIQAFLEKSIHTKNIGMTWYISEFFYLQALIWRQLWIWLAEAEMELGISQVATLAFCGEASGSWERRRDRVSRQEAEYREADGKTQNTCSLWL